MACEILAHNTSREGYRKYFFFPSPDYQKFLFVSLFWNTAILLLSDLWEAEEEVIGISDVVGHVVLSSQDR